MPKILLADDSAFMRKVLSDILVKNGYQELIEAENGNQAIEKYNAEHPDLVLLDIIMPEKDGIAVIKEIAPQGAKVLVISAVGQDDMIGQAKTSGAQGYIVKPFEEEQVMTEVKKILGGEQPAPVQTQENPQPAQPAVQSDQPQGDSQQPAQPAVQNDQPQGDSQPAQPEAQGGQQQPA